MTTTTDPMDGEEFAHIRSALGWTQQEMADLLGVSSKARVWAIENGHRPIRNCEAIVLRLLATGDLEIYK